MMLQNNYANLRRIVKNPKAYNRPSHTTLQNKRYSTSDYVIWFFVRTLLFYPHNLYKNTTGDLSPSRYVKDLYASILYFPLYVTMKYVKSSSTLIE